jgi:hypothetical protein
VTIGKDLISRGISYVGEDVNEPMTATTMIYKPGMSMHSVGICQTIGRITGCAMPSLKRRLYAPKDVIETYKSYNQNQEKYINEIQKTDAKLTKEVIGEMIFDKLSRNIDRPKLGLKMNIREEGRERCEDEERMKQLINMWWGANTIIGKILRYVYESESGVSEMELKMFLENNSYSKAWYSDLEQENKEYKHVFQRDTNQITKIRKEAKEYIKSL